MIATVDQARAAIAKLPREKINKLVLDILQGMYGEEDSDPTRTTDDWILNFDIEWTQDNIEMVHYYLRHNGLNPSEICRP